MIDNTNLINHCCGRYLGVPNGVNLSRHSLFDKRKDRFLHPKTDGPIDRRRMPAGGKKLPHIAPPEGHEGIAAARQQIVEWQGHKSVLGVTVNTSELIPH